MLATALAIQAPWQWVLGAVPSLNWWHWRDLERAYQVWILITDFFCIAEMHDTFLHSSTCFASLLLVLPVCSNVAQTNVFHHHPELLWFAPLPSWNDSRFAGSFACIHWPKFFTYALPPFVAGISTLRANFVPIFLVVFGRRNSTNLNVEATQQVCNRIVSAASAQQISTDQSPTVVKIRSRRTTTKPPSHTAVARTETS